MTESTGAYKYDVGEERAGRIWDVLDHDDSHNYVELRTLYHILNLFAADLAANPVRLSDEKEVWRYHSPFEQLQRIMFRVPQEPPFDPEKVKCYNGCVPAGDYNKLLAWGRRWEALYKEAVKK